MGQCIQRNIYLVVMDTYRSTVDTTSCHVSSINQTQTKESVSAVELRMHHGEGWLSPSANTTKLWAKEDLVKDQEAVGDELENNKGL